MFRDPDDAWSRNALKLLRIQRCSGRHSRHDDSTAFTRYQRTETVGVRWRQRTSVRRREPESQQVSLAFSIGPIFECSAVMQYRVIVQNLNVTRLKLHG